MNSMQRILATAALERPDRPAVAPQLFGFTARQFGVDLGRYVREGDVMARCQLRSRERFGTDLLFAISDVGVETEAAGSELIYHDHDYPTVGEYALHSAAEIKGLEVPTPERDGRMPEILTAIKAMRAAVKDNCPVVGCVLGPMTLAAQLMGPENALFLSHDEPEAFEALLHQATAIAQAYGAAQVEAGAHVVLIFDPAASPTVFPKATFIRYEQGLLADIFRSLGRAGAPLKWLHIAGPTVPIMEHMREIKVQMLSIDQSISLDDVQERMPKVCVVGNINCMGLLQEGPSLIKADCDRLLEEYGQRGGLILSSACEVPPQTSSANIMAMVRAAKDWK